MTERKKYHGRMPSYGAVQLDDEVHAAPSVAALDYFRDTVLAEAICPICRAEGLEYLHNMRAERNGTEVSFAYSMPINVRGQIEVFTDQAVQYGMCRECGFLASFSELAVKARYVAAVRDGLA